MEKLTVEEKSVVEFALQDYIWSENGAANRFEERAASAEDEKDRARLMKLAAECRGRVEQAKSALLKLATGESL